MPRGPPRGVSDVRRRPLVTVTAVPAYGRFAAQYRLSAMTQQLREGQGFYLSENGMLHIGMILGYVCRPPEPVVDNASRPTICLLSARSG
jgi:hypothetical protein